MATPVAAGYPDSTIIDARAGLISRIEINTRSAIIEDLAIAGEVTINVPNVMLKSRRMVGTSFWVTPLCLVPAHNINDLKLARLDPHQDDTRLDRGVASDVAIRHLCF